MKLNLENSHFLTESVRESNELKFAARTGRVRKEREQTKEQASNGKASEGKTRNGRERPGTARKGLFIKTILKGKKD